MMENLMDFTNDFSCQGDVPKSVASKILCEKNTKKLMDWLKSAVYSDTNR